MNAVGAGLRVKSQLKGQRCLICTQSSALRTFVHSNKFKNDYEEGQVTTDYRTTKN